MLEVSGLYVLRSSSCFKGKENHDLSKLYLCSHSLTSKVRLVVPPFCTFTFASLCNAFGVRDHCLMLIMKMSAETVTILWDK